MLSAKMEDYLKTIYELQLGCEGPVATSDIAETVDVTPPTATSMMEKLEDRGFVEREKYAGVKLTPEGETVALEVVRHHRLIETYLAEHLGYDWSEVHDEADRLEHHISEAFEERVAEKLGDPEVDPHGDPIPRETLDPVDEAIGLPLSEHEEGDAVIVHRVDDGDPEELAYLEDAGITPETTLIVEEVAPIGMVTVRFDGGETVSVPDRIADAIRVCVADETAAAPEE
jgi:DtxR family Mn-dependent transcriptional regulator